LEERLAQGFDFAAVSDPTDEPAGIQISSPSVINLIARRYKQRLLDGRAILRVDDSLEIESLANQIEATELPNDFPLGSFMIPKHPTNRRPA
jgi:hypothetical protein